MITISAVIEQEERDDDDTRIAVRTSSRIQGTNLSIIEIATAGLGITAMHYAGTPDGDTTMNNLFDIEQAKATIEILKSMLEEELNE